MSDARSAHVGLGGRGRVRRWPQQATAGVFFTHGMLFASWTAHIPQVKAHLHLSDGSLGLALLGAPLGSVSAMVISARLLPRLGSRRTVAASLVGYAAVAPFVGLAGSPLALFGVLFAWGAFQGALDVSMNTQAVAVERARQRPLMSGFHGFWSIGSFAGAAIGAAGAAIGVSLSGQLLLLGIPAFVIAARCTTHMVPDASSPTGPPSTQASPRRLYRPVLVLGGIAFASMLCEGAVADWASVYLRGPLHTNAAIAGLGYTAFLFTMVIVRLSGNRLFASVSVRRALPALAVIASVGFTLGLLGNQPVTALAGFGCLGIGLALIVPSVFSAAGRLPALSAGATIAAVSACGWAGFVCGPPLIGGIASGTSLPVALGLLPVLTTFIVIATTLAKALRAPARARS